MLLFVYSNPRALPCDLTAFQYELEMLFLYSEGKRANDLLIGPRGDSCC
jgi:hypothetical protein